MENLGILSILPPFLALGMAIRTRQVYPSLFLGIWLGWTILNGWNPLEGLTASIDALAGVFGDQERTLTILLVLLTGALIALAQYSGGTEGFVNRVSAVGWASTRRRAQILAWFIGAVIFVEGNIGIFTSGPVSRPIFDRLRISREKLAYLLDSTAAAKATVIPINSWGAYIIGLLSAQGVSEPLRAMITAIPLNVYALLALSGAFVVAWTGLDLGPMKEAERRARQGSESSLDQGKKVPASDDVIMLEAKPGVPHRARNLIVPILALVVAVFAGLFLTGDGNPMEGDGIPSVFSALLVAVAVGAVMNWLQGILSLRESTDLFMKGVGGMVPIGILLMLAFVMGDVCSAMGTGQYVAGAVEGGLPRFMIPAALFLVAGITSFATGTSWGTWAIMIPIAVPMIGLLDLNGGLVIASVLGGGIFGDHCSPISDSTIMASMAAGSDHIEHVRTQLPYALALGGITVLLYLVLGAVM